MKKEILLNGIWQLSGKTENGAEDICIEAQIPGYVHPALEKAGIIPPIFYRDNAEKCQWPEENEWIFTKEFLVDEYDKDFKAELCFGGVDTYADIYFNDQLVYVSSNMFIPFNVDVSNLLKVGKNVVKVVIKPYKLMIEGKPVTDCAAFTSDRVYVRRVQCTFYWDWVNRFVSAGIWRDVKLRFLHKAYIEDVFVKTSYIAKTSAGISIDITTVNGLSENCKFKVDIVGPKGDIVWTQNGTIFLDTITLNAGIRNPELWWPVGYGEHPLYTVNVTLTDSDDNPLDSYSVRTGIRTIAFECLVDEPGSEEEKRTEILRNRNPGLDYHLPGESYILLVNGERIFCTGGNWVPPTPFPSTTTADEYKNLVKLSADGNMNCIRIWGGGVYEQDLFYDLCDEMGVMITQDFMLSCGDYPEDDKDFMESFYKEVEASIIRLRNHTCIISWSGNNENTDGFDWDAPVFKDKAIQTEICLPLIEKLDPTRVYHFGSPYGGKGNNDLTIGDNHVSWWWKGAENITKHHFDMVGRFTSESPIGGYSMPSVLKNFLLEEDYLDPDSPVVEYHIKNNAFFTDGMGWPSIFKRLQRNATVMVGMTDDPLQNVYRFCYLQYEWARLAVEGMRRSNWYGSAIQYWMYNDCWPALGYAVIDYYGKPKGGWYGTKRAAAPIASTIGFKEDNLEFICLNNCLESKNLSYKISLLDCEKNNFTTMKSGNFTSNANIQTSIISIKKDDITIEDNAIVFLDIYDGDQLVDRSRWYKTWLADLKVPEAEVECVYDAATESVTFTCKKGVALGMTVDGDFAAEDNFIDLFEGESRTIKLKLDDSFKEIKLYGYNHKIVTIKE